MADYLYDGTFEGFLSCVYAHYYGEKADGIYSGDNYQPCLLVKAREIRTDAEKAFRVYDAIERKISRYDLQRVYKAFMSGVPEKENKLLKYIALGFKNGSGIRLLHGNQTVFDVERIERKVNHEIHRLCGLIRFSELRGGVLYSPVEPDHDVCEFLAGHFCDRFKNEPFIIHDKRRSKALFANGGDFYISGFSSRELPGFTENEEEYQKLWKKYFDTIAIKERINPKCQKNFMPVRYWKNLTEMRLAKRH